MTSFDEAEVARYRWHAVANARERLRVARDRSLDRRRLAENAVAAGQETFARALGDAADAHEAIARDLEASLVELERSCLLPRARAGWSREAW